jgi:hypothetical protein
MIDTAAKIPGFWFPNRIIAIVGTLPWAYFLWSGYDLCYGHHAQTVTGPPNEGQFHLYVATPLAGIILGAALCVFANKVPIWLVSVAFVLQVFSLIPMMAAWGGGI